MKTMELPKTPQNGRDSTTKTIASILLWAFIGSLFLLFIINIVFQYTSAKNDDLEIKRNWFDLLKNTLVLLGTALTTIIGYYFGQREGSLKSAQAEMKIKETELKADAIAGKALHERDQAARGVSTKESDAPDQASSSNIENNGEIIIPSINGTD